MQVNSSLLYGFEEKLVQLVRDQLSDTIHSINIENSSSFPSFGTLKQFMEFRQIPWDCNICNSHEFETVLIHEGFLLECYSRHFYYAHTPPLSIQELKSIIRSHYVLIRQILDNVNPRKIIFANVPHEGFDNLLHVLAIINNIQVFCCFQLPFAPNFIFANLASEIHSCFHATAMNLTPNISTSSLSKYIEGFMGQLVGYKEYGYMSELSPHPKIPSRYEYVYAFLRDLKNFSNTATANFCSSILRVYLARRQYSQYKKRLASIASPLEKINLSKGYIYVPLHLQPELTTSAFGSIFCDQTILIAMASHIARLTDAVVLCKENPKQSYPYRSSLFFETCRSLENVFFVSTSTGSRSLIKDALMVATVTGTAGLEAVAMGVPTLCVGAAWWKPVRGVSTSCDDAVNAIISYRDMLSSSNRANHVRESRAKLCEDLQSILEGANRGCTDSSYCPEFSIDVQDNISVLATSICHLLQKLDNI